MKKNSTMRLAVLLLVLTLITSCFVGGTFAKYTAGATIESEATVAKWSILVEGEDIAQSETIDVKLFDTIVDTVDDNTDADVAAGKIAPGTKGTFELVLENASEVTASYTVSFNQTGGTNIPLEFTVTDGTTTEDSLADLTGNIAMGDDVTVTVDWVWPYYVSDAGDTADNALGTAATLDTAKITVELDVVQKD